MGSRVRKMYAKETKVKETREKAIIRYEETARKSNKKTGSRLFERIGERKRGIGKWKMRKKS